MSRGAIEYTIPDKPNSRLQRYRLTEKGRALLAKGGQAREAPSKYGRRRARGTALAAKAKSARKRAAKSKPTGRKANRP